MKKWEYKVVFIKETVSGAIDEFNKLGSDGWELVSIAPLHNSIVSFAFFKRGIGAEPREEVRRTCCNKEDHDHWIMGTHPPH